MTPVLHTHIIDRSPRSPRRRVALLGTTLLGASGSGAFTVSHPKLEYRKQSSGLTIPNVAAWLRGCVAAWQRGNVTPYVST
jgi:hypothetical protein